MLRTKPYTPFLYLSPMLALLLFVFGYPIVSIFNFSTRLIRGASGPFIGSSNYQQILQDNVFQDAVKHNLMLLLAVPILLVISILTGVVLYERVSGWRVYRLIAFLPYVLAVPIVGIVFSNLLEFNGALNDILRAMRLSVLAKDWIGSESLALWSVMAVIIWREVGFGIVLFLARLLSLNVELLEAAEIDGAGWWKRLWHVIVPQLRSIIEFYVVIAVITVLSSVFAYVYTITRGGPGTATMIMELYIYNYAFTNGLPGIASAVAVVLLLATLILAVPVFHVRAEGYREEVG